MKRLFFSARPFRPASGVRMVQYAFADGCGNVVLSLFAELAVEIPDFIYEPAADLALKPVGPPAVGFLIRRACEGAVLVGFGDLQASLLPCEAVEAAIGVECAWRRFRRLGSLRPSIQDEVGHDLEGALALAGLGPLPSSDASVRALAVRELWRWMDGVF